MAGGETTPSSQWTASSSSSYAGMNQIKFAGLDSISAQPLRTPGSAQCTAWAIRPGPG